MADLARSFDVAVVGAGPAGVAAACRAAEAGAHTLLVDEGLAPGGQIYRHRPGQRPPEGARAWLERLSRCGATVLARTEVFDAEPCEDGFELRAATPDGAARFRAARVVLATGARERFLPFPGWTLPNVFGVGGAQAMLKSGLDVRGRTALVSGSGPLLVAVAAALARAGARIALVAEQAPFGSLAGFGFGLLASPHRVREALAYRAAFRTSPYRPGRWVTAAYGRGRVEGAVVFDGARAERVACDLLCVGYGLVPNTELARLLGCEVEGGAITVDASQRTSVPNIFAAGEPCGIAGVDVALVEGQIAGLGAAGRFEGAEAGVLGRARRRGRRYAAALDRAFRLRPELRQVPRTDTILCRCEDVTMGEIDRGWSPRQAKLATRAGMGPCQGRICGAALSYLCGWGPDAVRPPIKPIPLECLLRTEEIS